MITPDRSPLRFHGRDHVSIFTSGTSDPSRRGSDQGQQYPAEMRAW